MFVLALSLYNTWNRGVFLLCKITNLLIYSLKIEKNLQDHYLHKWKQYMITLTSEIKHIQLLKNFIELIIEIIQK